MGKLDIYNIGFRARVRAASLKLSFVIGMRPPPSVSARACVRPH